MTSADVFLKTSRAHPNTTMSGRKASYFWRWCVLLGGVLGTLLLNASTQASHPNFATIASTPIANQEAAPQPFEDGIYFYGQVAQPDELGAGYMVFESENNQIVGAMFMPHSSFDCFVGQIGDRELSMQITNSYTQERYAYTIALVATDEPVAATDTAIPLQLDGLIDLGNPRAAELSMLSTCQADLSPKASLKI